MDILRRELAPISAAAWEEIDTTAKRVLEANLSGRKFIDVAGPYGIDRAVATTGRLTPGKATKQGKLVYGIHEVQPLLETRVPFTLSLKELDAVSRGAQDIDLDPLTDACLEIAAFEEKAIYQGFSDGNIKGLQDIAKKQNVPAKLEKDAFVDALAEAQIQMRKEGVKGSANLVVSAPVWKFLRHSAPGGTLLDLVKKQIDGEVIYSGTVQDALLISARGGDLELTLGQDLAIGYTSHTADEVNLFMVESFTFRIFAPEAVMGLKLK